MQLEALVTAARNRYNATGSTFWGPTELYQLIYEGCLEMALRTRCLERTFETTTQIGVQEYCLPEYTIGVKRVVYRGKKLDKIDLEESDIITAYDETSQNSGTPTYYLEWEEKIRLFPIPAAAESLKIYTYNEPQPLTSNSVLEIPSRYHVYLLDYVFSLMVSKDEKFDLARFYLEKWNDNLMKIEAEVKKLKRSGANPVVKCDEVLGRRFL